MHTVSNRSNLSSPALPDTEPIMTEYCCITLLAANLVVICIGKSNVMHTAINSEDGMIRWCLGPNTLLGS